MEHGQERNRCIKRTDSNFSGVAANGDTINIDYCGSELSVAEKWCAHCDDWVSTEALGLIGFCICPKCKNCW